MSKAMTAEEIERFLAGQSIYRIACSAEGRQYVVPMIYAYHEGAMYGFTRDGMKLRMLRANPEVCIEVDRLDWPRSWESVIAWGTFEELTGDAAKEGAMVVLSRLANLEQSDESRERTERATASEEPAIVYRIVLGEKSGRYER